MPARLHPTFYYPLKENAPCLSQAPLRIAAFPESGVIFPFLNSLRHAETWVRNLHGAYDPQAGFFRIDPIDPHIEVGLPELAKYFFMLRTYGFLDHLGEYIANYSPDDIEYWLQQHLFAGARNPLRKRSPYRD